MGHAHAAMMFVFVVRTRAKTEDGRGNRDER